MSRTSRPRQALVAVAMLAMVAACSSGPSATEAAQVELSGLVLLGPECAAVPDLQGCTDIPTPAAIVVRQVIDPPEALEKTPAGGEPVARGTAGEDGRFVIDVPPGDYLLEATSLAAVSCAPLQITVPEEGIDVTVTCDTGIR